MRIVLHIFKDLFEMKRTVLISIFSLTFFLYLQIFSWILPLNIFLLKITNNYSNIGVFHQHFFYTPKSSHGFYHYIFLLKITNNYSNIGIYRIVTHIFALEPKN